jgi:hypothetical protein
MTFEEMAKAAAREAEDAVDSSMQKLATRAIVDEEDLTPFLLGRLEAKFDGEQIGGLTWTGRIMRHHRGIAAEEKATGADFVIHVELDTPGYSYSKGVFVQAKRVQPQQLLPNQKFRDLKSQCNKMLAHTAASYVFAYSTASMACGSASKISGCQNRRIHDECSWTSYRFFWELFRCSIGDPKIHSALQQFTLGNDVLSLTGSGSLDRSGGRRSGR